MPKNIKKAKRNNAIESLSILDNSNTDIQISSRDTITHGNKNQNSHIPILDDIDFNLWVLLDSAHFLIARMRKLELSKIGLTIEQAQVLNHLSITESVTMKGISYYNKRQRNSVSTLINRMVEAGLVFKVKEHDKKTYTIKATDKAKKKYKNITLTSLKKAFSSLRLEEKQVLAIYLRILRDTVEKKI